MGLATYPISVLAKGGDLCSSILFFCSRTVGSRAIQILPDATKCDRMRHLREMRFFAYLSSHAPRTSPHSNLSRSQSRVISMSLLSRLYVGSMSVSVAFPSV